MKNPFEELNKTLDLSYEKMLQELQKVKCLLGAEKKCIETKIEQTTQKILQYREEVCLAIKFGDEDLTRSILTLKQKENGRLLQLQTNYQAISDQIKKLKIVELKF